MLNNLVPTKPNSPQIAISWPLMVELFKLRHLESNYKISHQAYLRLHDFSSRVDNFEECFLNFTDIYRKLFLEVDLPLTTGEQQILSTMTDLPTFQAMQQCGKSFESVKTVLLHTGCFICSEKCASYTDFFNLSK